MPYINLVRYKSIVDMDRKDLSHVIKPTWRAQLDGSLSLTMMIGHFSCVPIELIAWQRGDDDSLGDIGDIKICMLPSLAII